MARILCIWELGGNLGHLMNLKYFVDSALSHGHEVAVACKELHHLNQVFPTDQLKIFQSPYHWRKPPKSQFPYICYAQVATSRFANYGELAILCDAWESIFKSVKPDIVIYDHAPSALISSIGKGWQKLIIGSAFIVPGCDQTYLGIFPGIKSTRENRLLLQRANQRLRQMVDRFLKNRDRPPIGSLKELFTQADRLLLLTTPEMDYYGPRKTSENIEYLGIDITDTGTTPHWPAGGEYKVFCYIENFPRLEKLLDLLNHTQLSVIIYGVSAPKNPQKPFKQLYFSDKPLNIREVLKHADLVINMGNHSTSLQAMLANTPQLMIPGHQEQLFNARQVVAQGRGIILDRNSESFDRPFSQAIELMKEGRGNRRSLTDNPFAGTHLRKRIDQIIGEY